MFTPSKATKFIIFCCKLPRDYPEVEVFRGFRTSSLVSDKENSKAQLFHRLSSLVTLLPSQWHPDLRKKRIIELQWLSFYRDYFCQRLCDLSTEVDSKFILFRLDGISLPYLSLDYYSRPTLITGDTALWTLFAIQTPHFLASDGCILN